MHSVDLREPVRTVAGLGNLREPVRTVAGLSRPQGIQTLQLQHVGSSSMTRDPTQAPCIGRVEF